MLTEHGANELQRIQTPCLVLVGDRDPFELVEEAVALYRHLPNAELAVGTNNDGPKNDRSHVLNHIVLDFLQRQVGPSINR